MALNWLTTEAGRKFIRTAVGILGGAGFGVYLLPHTYFLDKTKEIVQMYKHGEPVPLDSTVKERAHEVLQDLTYMLDREKNSITFFTVYGPDVFHKGSTQLRSGAIIGLPVNYSYESPDQVERNQLQLGRHPNFNWQSETGQKLVESLILHPQAQKFAIAREISYSNTNYVYTNAVIAVSSFLTAYMAGNFINRSLHLYERARRQRMIMYGILSAMGGVLYLILTDALSLHYDRYVDNKVANLGKEYVMGGVEYYQKVLDRNKAIRRALGETGESWYTAQGNENEWIRVRHMPLTARLDYMKGRLKEFERKKPDPPVSSRGDPIPHSRSSQLDYMARGTPPAPLHSSSSKRTMPTTHSQPAHSDLPVLSPPAHSDLPVRSTPPMHTVSTLHTAPNNHDSSILLGPKSNQRQPPKPSMDRPQLPIQPQPSPPLHSQFSPPAHDPNHVCKTHQKQSIGYTPGYTSQSPTTWAPENQTQSSQNFNKQPSYQLPAGNQPSRSYSPHIPPPSPSQPHSTALIHQSPTIQPSQEHKPSLPVQQSSTPFPQFPSPVHSTLTHQASTPPHQASTPPHQASTLPHQASTLPHQASTLPHQASTLPHQASTLPHQASTSPHQASTPSYQTPSPVPQSATAIQQPQVKLTGQTFTRNTPVSVDGVTYSVGLPRETHEKVQVETSTPSIIPELFRATFRNLWHILVNL